jgi:hypothetical protein
MWQVHKTRAALAIVFFTLFFGWVAGAALMAGLLLLAGHEWIRPVVGAREMPNFDTEAEALMWWRFSRNPWIPLPSSVRDWRWRL